jgi:hypothetical protein
VQLDRWFILCADKLNDVAAEALFVRLGQAQGDEIAAAIGDFTLDPLADKLWSDCNRGADLRLRWRR